MAGIPDLPGRHGATVDVRMRDPSYSIGTIILLYERYRERIDTSSSPLLLLPAYRIVVLVNLGTSLA